jgi:hypothetical protein
VKLITHLHLVPRSKNAWSYSSTPQYAFIAWFLVKHRDNFTSSYTRKNRVLRRIFGPKREEDGSWRKLHNDELHSLYSSLNIVRVI